MIRLFDATELALARSPKAPPTTRLGHRRAESQLLPSVFVVVEVNSIPAVPKLMTGANNLIRFRRWRDPTA